MDRQTWTKLYRNVRRVTQRVRDTMPDDASDLYVTLELAREWNAYGSWSEALGRSRHEVELALDVIAAGMSRDRLDKPSRVTCRGGVHLEVDAREEGDAETGPVVRWSCPHCRASGTSWAG